MQVKGRYGMQDAKKVGMQIFTKYKIWKQNKTNTRGTWRMCVISLMMIVLCTWKADKKGPFENQII